MDAKVVYWSFVFLWLLATLAVASRGRRRARAGEIARHRRLMGVAIAGIGLFLVSYVAKLSWLGREDLARWGTGYVWTLRVHELLMVTMVVAGGGARWLARRYEPTGFAVAAWHRRLGRTSLVAGLLGLLTAGVILAGMLARGGEAPAGARRTAPAALGDRSSELGAEAEATRSRG